MMCEYVGCLKQLGACPGCKALYSVVDVSDPIVAMIQNTVFDGKGKRILSSNITNMSQRKCGQRSRFGFFDSGDEADIEPNSLPTDLFT